VSDRPPIRTCVGCIGRAPQSGLVRFVGAGEGLRLDRARREPGRGAYLHPDPGCWDRFVRARGPIRSLRRSVDRRERERLVASLGAGGAR
jgi:predicted RNA-binding protein YlxR (DUF448 family)